jgi:hypothetical protein
MWQVQREINAFLLPHGSRGGSIYRAVRGSVYNVQTTPNCPINCAKYKVTGLLQSFIIYIIFGASQSMIDMCPCLATHYRCLQLWGSGNRDTFSLAAALGRPLAPTFDHASVIGVSRLRL